MDFVYVPHKSLIYNYSGTCPKRPPSGHQYMVIVGRWSLERVTCVQQPVCTSVRHIMIIIVQWIHEQVHKLWALLIFHLHAYVDRYNLLTALIFLRHACVLYYRDKPHPQVSGRHTRKTQHANWLEGVQHSGRSPQWTDGHRMRVQ